MGLKLYKVWRDELQVKYDDTESYVCIANSPKEAKSFIETLLHEKWDPETTEVMYLGQASTKFKTPCVLIRHVIYG